MLTERVACSRLCASHILYRQHCPLLGLPSILHLVLIFVMTSRALLPPPKPAVILLSTEANFALHLHLRYALQLLCICLSAHTSMLLHVFERAKPPKLASIVPWSVLASPKHQKNYVRVVPKSAWFDKSGTPYRSIACLHLCNHQKKCSIPLAHTLHVRVYSCGPCYCGCSTFGVCPRGYRSAKPPVFGNVRHYHISSLASLTTASFRDVSLLVPTRGDQPEHTLAYITANIVPGAAWQLSVLHLMLTNQFV